ncbi:MULTISPECIES: Imm50 family immunity protein [unclassified Bacteroides]|uniref:Imm50 family immunity protein n=1 Tax=unclassified Bacteroides TaxID=2646097 RepID=UPI0004E1DC67|nr:MULTISPECIES: Imm50 family immunity protein [unclassified Bacteroides]
MDYSLFDDAKCISMIYKEKMPDLQNVEIVKMEIEPGEDAVIYMNVDTTELPQDMPPKWLMRKVNTVQFLIAFIGIEFIEFSLTNGMNCNIAISDNNGKKRVCITNSTDGKKLCFDAKWIFANEISAYVNNTSDPAEWL